MNEIEFLKSLRALPNKKGSHTLLQPPYEWDILMSHYWSRSHYTDKYQATCCKFQYSDKIFWIFR